VGYLNLQVPPLNFCFLISKFSDGLRIRVLNLQLFTINFQSIAVFMEKIAPLETSCARDARGDDYSFTTT